VVLVSHDRHLLAACADRLWLVAGGQVHAFDGDLDDYRRGVLSSRSDDDRTRAPKPAAPTSTVETRRAAAEKRLQAAPLRQRVEAAEKAMAQLTSEIGRIDQRLADGTLFSANATEAARLAKQRADAVRALAQAENEWLAATSALESAMA
jgi:ATP-binding cassette subfamily F protein 3